MTAASYASGSISMKTLIMPEWWLLWPMPVAFVLLAIEFVFRMRRLALAERAAAGGRGFRVLRASRCPGRSASLLLLGGSTVLLFIGMPVAFSFIAINLVGAWLFLGGDAGLRSARAQLAAPRWSISR